MSERGQRDCSVFECSTWALVGQCSYLSPIKVVPLGEWGKESETGCKLKMCWKSIITRQNGQAIFAFGNTALRLGIWQWRTRSTETSKHCMFGFEGHFYNFHTPVGVRMGLEMINGSWYNWLVHVLI